MNKVSKRGREKERGREKKKTGSTRTYGDWPVCPSREGAYGMSEEGRKEKTRSRRRPQNSTERKKTPVARV